MLFRSGFITKEQYNTALTEQVHIIEVSEQKQMYDMAYFVEYAISDVVTHLLEKRGLSNTTANRNAVENELRTSGYQIYTPSIRRFKRPCRIRSADGRIIPR